MRGRVKFWNDVKGWGFITPDDGSVELFVHFRHVRGSGRRTLVGDEPVEFDVQETEKGFQAINVQRLNPA